MASETVHPIDWSHPPPYTGQCPLSSTYCTLQCGLQITRLAALSQPRKCDFRMPDQRTGGAATHGMNNPLNSQPATIRTVQLQPFPKHPNIHLSNHTIHIYIKQPWRHHTRGTRDNYHEIWKKKNYVQNISIYMNFVGVWGGDVYLPPYIFCLLFKKNGKSTRA